MGTSGDGDDTGVRSAALEGWKVDLLLALAVLAMTVPFLREWSAQPASRYLYTAAIVDDRTFQLDPYLPALGEDYAVRDGRIYSDKAPYQPLVTVPVYALYRALGGDPFQAGLRNYEVGHRYDIGLWIMTVWSAALPTAALAIVIRRYVARTHPRQALPVALALVFGTVVLPFGSLLFGHALAALTGFGAWVLIRRPTPTTAQLIGAGVLLGLGQGTEYPQMLIAAIIGVYALAVLKGRALWVAAAGFVALVPMMIVNTVIFGGPTRNAYQGYQPHFPSQGQGAFGVVNLVAPIPKEFVLALTGDRGLLSLTPVMLVALIGCILTVRKGSVVTADSRMALVLLAVFLLISTGVSGYGGSAPGPRYLVPIIPFFAAPLAVAWRRWPPVATIAALWGAFWMTVATLTDPLYQDGRYAPADWFSDLVHGRFDRSFPNALLGTSASLLPAVAAAVLAWLALRADRADRAAGAPARPVPTADAVPEGAAP